MIWTKGEIQSFVINLIAPISAFILTRELLSFFFFRKHKNHHKKNEQELVLPPKVHISIFESINQLKPGYGLWFMLGIAKRIDSDIFRLRIPLFGDLYIIGSPTTMREILVDKTSDKPRKLYRKFDIIPGNRTMFSSKSDETWKGIRKGLAHAFSSSEVQRMKDICEKHVQQWIEKKLEPCVQNGESFDPAHEMCRITFGVILEAAFEYNQSNEDEYEQFSHHVEVCLKEFLRLQPLRELYKPLLPDYKNALQCCKEIQEFSKKILDTYRNNQQKSTNKTVIRLICENKALTSDKERIAQITGMILAGHDTTGNTLGSILVLLAKNPKVSQKLQKELLSMEASKRSKSQYLKLVITEGNRLVPVAAMGGIRQTGRDIVVSQNVGKPRMIIPKGAICYLPQMLANQNPQLYPDPHVFRPERWETADKAMWDAHFAFSLGHRNCLGQNLAVSELYSVVPRLLSEYKFEVDKIGKLDIFLTLKYAGALLKPSKLDLR